MVAFHGSFVAVGTVWTSCCDGGNPERNRGVTWTSRDGRSWTLRNPVSDLKHASLRDLVTDGTRLIAVGTYATPTSDGQGIQVPAVWVSSDGIRWVRASGAIPSVVAVGAHGLIGAAVTEDPSSSATSVRFVTSTNGLKWTSVSKTFNANLGGLAAAADGTAIAVGDVPGPDRADGTRTADTVVWRSTDGTAWTGPETIAHDALPAAVTSDGSDFLVVVHRDVVLPSGTIDYASEVWRLVEGTAPRPAAIALGEEEYFDSIFVIGDVLIATGDTMVSETANAMVWISTNGGAAWGRLEDSQAFQDINNEVAGIVQTPAGLLAVGDHWDSTTMHPLPSVWLAGR